MTPDRLVFSFVIGWVVLIAVLIVLDWLGNPDRGGFRPKGDRPPRGCRTRQHRRSRKRLEEDAAVRATLRDAYGASSLRLTWTRALEDAVRKADDTLVVPEGVSPDDVLDVASVPVEPTDYTAVMGDPLPNVDELENKPDLAGADTDDDTEPDPLPDSDDEPELQKDPRTIVGWRVGVHPLARTRSGAAPSAATIRTRVWKNHAAGHWDAENAERLRAGRAPRRLNPITGANETAKVDIASGTAEWPGAATDPFEADR